MAMVSTRMPHSASHPAIRSACRRRSERSTSGSKFRAFTPILRSGLGETHCQHMTQPQVAQRTNRIVFLPYA